MRTQIFAYRDVLGAVTDLNNGRFLNDPRQPGQLGCVVACTDVDITREAKALLRRAPRESGSFADVMLTRHTDGTGSVGLLGFGCHLFRDVMISRDCDTSVLDDMNEVELAVPQGFVDAVDDS